jgi:hypothetical protein
MGSTGTGMTGIVEIASMGMAAQFHARMTLAGN